MSDQRKATVCGAVTDDEQERVDRAAARRGMTRSEFVRSAAIFCAGLQDRPEAGRRVRAILADAPAPGEADDHDDEQGATR